MKERIKKEYLRRTRKLLETKLYCRNHMNGLNTWADPFVSYLGSFLKWTREELQQMDQRTRKLMVMPEALHSRDDIDTLYVSRKRFANIIDSPDIDTTTRRLHLKARRKIGYSHQKQYWLHKDPQNGNKKKREEKNLWKFLATNKRHITRENVDVVMKEKPYERNWIYVNIYTTWNYS